MHMQVAGAVVGWGGSICSEDEEGRGYEPAVPFRLCWWWILKRHGVIALSARKESKRTRGAGQIWSIRLVPCDGELPTSLSCCTRPTERARIAMVPSG